MHRDIILLREEKILFIYDLLRLQREEIRGDCSKFHDKELHNLCLSPYY
jgi:hypothetical protein